MSRDRPAAPDTAPVAPAEELRRQLLHQALDFAHRVQDAPTRRALILAAGLLAHRNGWDDVLADWMVDAPEPALRARLRWETLVAAPEAPGPGPARPAAVDPGPDPLALAVDELLAQERWHPLDDRWLRRDDALAALAIEAGRRGAAGLVAALGAAMAEETPGPLAWLSLARLWVSPARGGRAEARWRSVAAQVGATADPRHRHALAQAFVRVAVAAGQPGRAADLWEASTLGPRPRVALAQALAGALAEAGEGERAAGLWSAAVDLAEESLPVDRTTVEALCAIAVQQERTVGPVMAELTWTRTIQRVAGVALPSDSRTDGPWSALLRTALRHHHWSTRLRRALRRRAVLPPAWAAALALLDLRAGYPERARQTAVALEASQASWGRDLEPACLGAVLFAELGDLARARRLMERVLVDAGDGPLVLALPAAPGLARPAERVFVDLLAQHGGLAEAALLGRMVPDPGLRALLLTRLAAQALATGGDEPRELALEAAATLADGEPAAWTTEDTAARLILVLARVGEAPVAGGVLRRLLSNMRELPHVVWSSCCAGLLAALARPAGRPFLGELRQGIVDYVAELGHPDIQAQVLTAVLAARPGVPFETDQNDDPTGLATTFSQNV